MSLSRFSIAQKVFAIVALFVLSLAVLGAAAWKIADTLGGEILDVNGDGKVKVTVKGIWLALDFETQDAALQQLMQSSEDKLNSDFYLCESTLFIVDDPTAIEQRYGCFQTLDGTDPEEGDVLSVADFALPLQDTALANVQSESSTLWYAARRLNEGMDADTAAAVASYEVDKDGVIKYKFWDKNSALEKAAKVQGLYEKDNDQKKDPVTIITRRIVG